MSMNQFEFFLFSLSVFLAAIVSYLGFKYYKLKLRLIETQALQQNEPLLLERFRSLASQVLESSTDSFLKLASQTLEKETVQTKSDLEKNTHELRHLVEPLKQKIDAYESHLQALERERQKSYLSVENELRRVIEVSSTLNKETAALKNALKRPNVRGRWGEVQLKNCVELAGMSEFADITFQDSQTTTEGQRLIPDMTVRMPGGRVIVVDAKTPIDAFLLSLEATDDDTRATELARHGRHVKEHVKLLSTKAYSEQLKNSADFTVMFLPNESFLYAALETDPSLMEFAIQKKILIATPPTLIGLLKVIRFGWSEERLAENAQKISEVGTELHKRLADFVDAFTNIGKHIDKAKSEYESGLNRLQSRVLVQAQRLEDLGVKSNKNIIGVSGCSGESQ
jgi:DNA recombination protein RmuC